MNSRRSILLFCLSTFFFWNSLYVFIPFLPVYASSLPMGTISAVGLALGSYSVALILFRIPLGVWSDKIGRRKPFIIAGLAVISCGALGLALSPNIWFLTVARLLTGVGAAVWVVFTVLFSSYFPSEKAPHAMGVLAFLMGASQVVATYGGGYLAENYGFKSVFYAAAILAFLGTFFMLKVEEAIPVEKQKFSLAILKRLFVNPLLVQVSVAAAIIMLIIFTASLGFLPIYGNQLHASKTELGLLSMVMFLFYTLASLLTTFLVPRCGLRLVVTLGALLMLMGSLIVPLSEEVRHLFLPQVLMGIGWGLTFPLLMGLSIRNVLPSERATAMGVFQSVYGLGMFLGPLLAGILASLCGLEIVFFFCSALGLIAVLISITKVPLR